MCTHASMHAIAATGKIAQPIHPTGREPAMQQQRNIGRVALCLAIFFSLLCTLGTPATLRFKSKHNGKSVQGLRANIPPPVAAILGWNSVNGGGGAGLSRPHKGEPLAGIPTGDRGGIGGECAQCNCWNSNNLLGDREQFNFGEKDLCENLISSIGPSHGNAEIFFEACHGTLGSVCNHQCMDLAQLFDRMDFTAIPPTSMHGGKGYAFNVKDCKNCLLEGDCYPKPMPSAKAVVSAPWYGDTQMPLDTPLKIKGKPAKFRI